MHIFVKNELNIMRAPQVRLWDLGPHKPQPTGSSSPYSLVPIPCFYPSQGFTNEDAISSKCLTLRVASFA
jgi:hypothetical protein